MLSGGFPKAPKNIDEGITGTSLSPADLVRHLTSIGSKHVYVDGGKTIQSFLRENLIHEMTVTRVPVLIGEGIPLFGPLAHDVKMKHIETKAYESGFVQSKYKVTNDA
ncbi:MAG: dihydrofolate reductase family protein [Pseudomonadota bacterium]